MAHKLPAHGGRPGRQRVPVRVHPLDDYLRRHAANNARMGLAAAYVLLRGEEDPADWPAVLGYFTLSMNTLPAEVARVLTGMRLPGYPIPVTLIGRLATDERVRGHGIGGGLLTSAIEIIVDCSNVIACFGIVVDAKHARAQEFYAKYGFTTSSPDGPFPRRCFLHRNTAEAAIRSSSEDSA